jgi:hypothetical protein
MLRVVEEQQLAPRLDAFDQGLSEILAGLFLHAERLGNGLDDVRRVAQGGQLNEPGSVRIVIEGSRCDLQGQPCLAAAARTRESQQTGRRQQLLDLGDLRGAPDEARQLLWEVVVRPERLITDRHHVQGEPVPLPGDRGNRARAQDLAQCRHMRLQGVLFDDHLAPDSLHQLVLGHQVTARSTSAHNTSSA